MRAVTFNSLWMDVHHFEGDENIETLRSLQFLRLSIARYTFRPTQPSILPGSVNED